MFCVVVIVCCGCLRCGRLFCVVYYSGAGVGLEVINSVVWWVVCALLM